MRVGKNSQRGWILFICTYTLLVLGGLSIADSTDVTAPGDVIQGFVNDGRWPDNEAPANVIDDNINTKYLHFLSGAETSGFRVTPAQPNTVVVGLTLTSANDAPGRDPTRYELYGSNGTIDGPYTLISSGPIEEMSRIDPLPRYTTTAPIVFSNTAAYHHYQLVFPEIRDFATGCMQVAEVELLGVPEGGWAPLVEAGPGQVLIVPHAKTTLAGEVQLFGSLDPQTVQMEWTLDSSPEGVTLQDLVFTPDRFSADPNLRLPNRGGMYRLTLTVSTESHTVSDGVIIIVADSLCPAGDLSGDCRVDTQDLLAIAQVWLEDSPYLPDLDGRGDGVDLSDFVVLAEHWAARGPAAVISEFLAINAAKYPPGLGELLDEDNESSDWIELCNPLDEPVDLAGWYLTDDPADLTRWRIPALTLEPEQFAIVFASGKDRQTPGEPLHTNFSLSSDPDFLALVEPDGETIAHQFHYPNQYGLLSYGLASPDVQPAEPVALIAPGAPAQALIPTDDSLSTTWTTRDFVPAGWQTGTTGVGYERDTNGAYDYRPWIGLDTAAMYRTNSSVYIRIPFEIEDLTGLRDLVLSVMYDDGFVAYLNGMLVTSANSPASLAWNSRASMKHDDWDAVLYESFPLPPDALEVLRKGTNVLAIHGLNENNNSSDFLILPRLTAVQERDISITSLVEAYFPRPTPGVKNTVGQMNLGPLVRDVTRNPLPPQETQDLAVTASVSPTLHPVGGVEMIYRVGFGPETTVAMADDGQAPDAAAGDGVFTAVIPASAYGPGDMVRWAVLARDSEGAATREPLFLLEENSPRYFGTVAQDPSTQTNLPVFRYFVQDLASASTRMGTRCSVFYLGEFYDNVFIRLRGGFTTHGRKFQFNDGEHFLFDPQYERVDEINLNEAGLDPTYIRPMLSFQTYADAGVPASLSFPLHVVRNNSYLDVRIFVEQPDRHLLRRVGLDDNGAFYKVYSDLSTELPDEKPDEQPERKITRLDEDNSDLQALRDGISPLNPDRGVYLFDHVNLPAVIGYMAVNTLVHENDHTHKNYFLYQDTDHTGEWMFIPWDKDLTFGINNGVPGIVADQDWPGDIRSPSHPFFGSRNHQKVDYQWNRLFDAVIADPTAREMYLRRLRTLMDAFLQPPGTHAAELKYEGQIDAWVSQLAYELNSPAYLAEVDRIKTQYLPVRRQHLYVNHLHGSTWPDEPAQIPDAQPRTFPLQIGAVEYNPASWNQDQEYIEVINPNPFAADISGWTMEGGVEHTFAPGTVIPAGGTLYLTPNALAFRARAASPTGGQRRFVQGGYQGHLSNWGETLTIYDPQRNVAASHTYAGNPTDVQRYLRITELMYHPADAREPGLADEEFEYIELTNTSAAALSLDGVAFTDGIDYTFPAGLSLAPGEYLLLVKNPAAFALRYAPPAGVQILGGYDGYLSNGGETIKLEDRTHSSVLEFTYNDNWYSITDGDGYSLTFGGNLAGLPDAWDESLNWRASTLPGGSPGLPEQGLAAESIVFNELLAHSHAAASDWIELHNTTGQAVNIGGWFLTDDNTDLATIRKYEIPADTVIPAGGFVVFVEGSSFGSDSLPPERRFALSEAGETVYLFSAEAGQVTGTYVASQKFEASETGVTLGRYEKPSLSGGYNFVRMADATPLAVNSGPRVAGVVITELMYNPAAGADYEYLELLNRSDAPVTLMTEVTTENPQGVFTTETLPWRIEGIGYEFEANLALAPGERIIVARNLAAFTAAWGAAVPAGTRVLGPYDGKLNNGGENIELQIPGDLEWGKTRICIPIEKVEYAETAPWPEALESLGQSLTRIDPAVYADDPANWQGAAPSPGF